jgi:hypothetical protein
MSMSFEEAKIIQVASHYLSYTSDEEILNGYRTLQDFSEDRGYLAADECVMIWSPLRLFTVNQILGLIDNGVDNLNKFLEEWQSLE